MKIYYKSKLAKILTFLADFTTMMFFGVVITERKKLSGRTISHLSLIHISEPTRPY